MAAKLRGERLIPSVITGKTCLVVSVAQVATLERERESLGPRASVLVKPSCRNGHGRVADFRERDKRGEKEIRGRDGRQLGWYVVTSDLVAIRSCSIWTGQCDRMAVNGAKNRHQLTAQDESMKDGKLNEDTPRTVSRTQFWSSLWSTT
jgi:hypothetical protein